MSSRRVRIAVVGCGAVARESILPVLAGHEGVVIGPLVDRDEARARGLADAYGVSTVATDMSSLSRDHVDGVILATPPAHHAPATLELVRKGLHVLVEKPMAVTAADAHAMVKAADEAGVALSVGLYRRFLPSAQLLRAMIERREFGRPLSVDVEEGGPYNWPAATLDVLKRASGGGGVFIDIGSHLIDLVLYILQGTPRLDRYLDNERGGIETDCQLFATADTPWGAVPMRFELSRTRELRGSIRIVCEEATLELRRPDFTRVTVHRAGKGVTLDERPIQYSAEWSGSEEFVGYEAFRLEVDDWIAAFSGGAPPIPSGRSVAPVVALIEEAYQVRQRLKEPGDEFIVPPARHEQRKRVLVTGAGGFLGGRTVELLRDQFGWDAVPLIREPKSAARLARYSHEILLGDICSKPDMERVLKGCDAVVHCAVGTSWKADETRRVTVDGTRIVAEAARAAGVARFVHISSLSVHKRQGMTVVDESGPLEPPTYDAYGNNKLDAERALAEVAGKGLSTVVLRPTRIFGPFSRTFTIRPLQALREGRLAIGGDADIPANMVYVDNVVAAIERALAAPAALSGQAYLITDDEQLSLKAFYEWFGRAWGMSVRVLPDWREEGDAGSERGWFSRLGHGVTSIAKSSEFRGIVRKVLETDPIGTVPRRMWDRNPAMQQKLLRRFGSDPAVVYRRQPSRQGEDLIYHGEPARIVSAKATRDLGYTLLAAHNDAMDRTLEWAKYARLLPSDAAR